MAAAPPRSSPDPPAPDPGAHKPLPVDAVLTDPSDATSSSGSGGIVARAMTWLAQVREPALLSLTTIASLTTGALTVQLLIEGPIGAALMAGMAAAVGGAVVLCQTARVRRAAAKGGEAAAPSAADLLERLQEWEQRLVVRQRRLDRRLVTFFEFLEYPIPTDVGRSAAERGPAKAKASDIALEPADGVLPGDRIAERIVAATGDLALADLGAKDRMVREIGRRAAEDLFNAIKSGRFAPGGAFDPRLLRDEMTALFERIAKIYRPGEDRPLMTVSTGQLLRALSRINLQLQMLLDELPINLKDRSLKSMYQYYATSVRVWGYYKNVEPYMPYLRYAWYAGRIATGMNPLAAVGWFAAGKLTGLALGKMSQHFAEMMAVASLERAVEIVIAEAAGLFGGDYRHRGSGWIYAAELTELYRRLPVTRDTLQAALREAGTAELASDYDRMWLYRLVAAHKSADPAKYAPYDYLTRTEREDIAVRLERFLSGQAVGWSASERARWRKDAEGRLGLRLKLAPGETATTGLDGTARRAAGACLLEYLAWIKESPPDGWADRVGSLQTWRTLRDEEAAELLLAARLVTDEDGSLRNDGRVERIAAVERALPPLEPTTPEARTFVQDLATLAVGTPYHADDEALVGLAAARYRVDAKVLARHADRARQEALTALLPSDHPGVTLDADTTRALLDWLSRPATETFARYVAGGESSRGAASAPLAVFLPTRSAARQGDRPVVQAIYPRVTGDRPAAGGGAAEHFEGVLVATDVGWIVWRPGAEEPVVWAGPAYSLRHETRSSVFGSRLTLTGGRWVGRPAADPPRLDVAGPTLRGGRSHFGPLTRLLGEAGGSA